LGKQIPLPGAATGMAFITRPPELNDTASPALLKYDERL
jgi:hypothetical protein